MVLPFRRMQFRVVSFLALLAVLVAASPVPQPAVGVVDAAVGAVGDVANAAVGTFGHGQPPVSRTEEY